MQGEVQSFATAPQAVRSRTGGKYRDEDGGGGGSTNMMNDRRVVRGNTNATMVAPKQDMAEVQKQREAQRRRLMRANQTQKSAFTPDPVAGRKNLDIQTDSYLEELTERTVDFEAETQTDFLLDRPPSPLFMPAKIGVDIDTQIEHGDLFDFDEEVEPVLEVLVGKTLEQSMMEVLEEEELSSLAEHQEAFEKKRNTQMLEVQRMEAAEKRRSDEMERRMQQASAQRERDLSVMKKVISRTIASSYLSSLKDRTLGQLLDAGVFADSIQGAVESSFVPDLLKQVSGQMQEQSAGRQTVVSVMKSSIQAKLDTHQKVLNSERERLAAIDAAEKQARIERQEARLRIEADKQRILKEQQAMMDWEVWQPPPPPQVTLTSVTTEDPIKAVADDGKQYAVLPDKLAELTALIESLVGMEPAKLVVASVLEADGAIEGFAKGSKYVDDFRLADLPQVEEAEATLDEGGATAPF